MTALKNIAYLRGVTNTLTLQQGPDFLTKMRKSIDGAFDEVEKALEGKTPIAQPCGIVPADAITGQVIQVVGGTGRQCCMCGCTDKLLVFINSNGTGERLCLCGQCSRQIGDVGYRRVGEQ